MPFAEKYLQKMYSLPVDADTKGHVDSPTRTFATLKNCLSIRQEAFVDSAFDELVWKVRRTLLMSGKLRKFIV